ncbi:hypothetical protein QUF80_11380 [Desulfococcaceae bacterium HSG8]|nr:hypothetical protein [Desulfococcaceae bacterium HSG8]
MTEENKAQLERRCPRLGSPVSFQYCTTCGDEEQPCFKVFDCWWEDFDVVAYLKDKLPENQFNALAASKPKPKVLSLVELIEQAKKRIED